ncbi:hypothetical protein FPV67DRAFT_1403111, partial [Lyophyllum atratum]
EVITKARVASASSDEDATDNEDETIKRKGKKKGKGKDRADKPAARWEYYVKWAGYKSKYNTWEPEENVAGCQRLLASFWEHIGTDNADYFVGHEVKAEPQWISKSKLHSFPKKELTVLCLQQKKKKVTLNESMATPRKN